MHDFLHNLTVSRNAQPVVPGPSVYSHQHEVQKLVIASRCEEVVKGKGRLVTIP